MNRQPGAVDLNEKVSLRGIKDCRKIFPKKLKQLSVRNIACCDEKLFRRQSEKEKRRDEILVLCDQQPLLAQSDLAQHYI